MPASQLQQLAGILELSQHMLEAARAADWYQVAIQETRRQSLIEQCFSTAVAARDAVEAAALMGEILHLNRSLEQLADRARQAIGLQIQVHSRARAAQTAYLKCAP